MKPRDFLIVALAPLPVLLIPLVGILVSRGWKWSLFDFVGAWLLLAGATLVFRFVVNWQVANLAYRAAAALAVAAGFFMTWVTLAVQIIGDENPANLGYLVVVLIGLVGAGLARGQARHMARAALACSLATFMVPVIAYLRWPGDFSPGVAKVFLLNAFFVLAFAAAGLLFQHAAGQSRAPAATS